MANRTWTNGGGDGLFTTAGNWSGAAVPTTGDNIIVPWSNAAINCTGMTPAAFGSLDITPECARAIGSSGTPLSGSFTQIRHRGRAGAKLFFADTAVGVTSYIFIAGQQGADLAELTGALPFIAIERGRATVLSTATGLDKVIVGHLGSPTSDAYLTIQSTGTAASLEINGGLCICESIITAAHVSGNGVLVRRGTAACTALNACDNARVYYEGTGTITDLFAKNNAYVDLDKKYQDSPSVPSDDRTSTVTVTRSVRMHNAELFMNSVLITKTNATVDWNAYGVAA